jgi:hypothetical protein
MSIRVAMSLLGQHFEDILRLFLHVLASSFFSFGSQFYRQTAGMVMSLPLFPVTVNFFMADSLEWATHRLVHLHG